LFSFQVQVPHGHIKALTLEKATSLIKMMYPPYLIWFPLWENLTILINGM